MIELDKAASITAALLVAWVSYSPVAYAQTRAERYASTATAAEIAQLPTFCMNQYTGATGPEYEIRGCGIGMNHYCPGLISAMRAKKSGISKGQKLQHLTAARRETLYTLNYMKGYPNCPIREHAETTFKIVDAQWRALGGK